ncbi:hypothetical protein [Moritella yayanosii]|uniref:Uncharacterized protein n=1 Tax=Moritella yayanosii TaxID=69539 RepID=A0A330LV71_9GAMM|nr:hypothetical protein [Moritella yayanosii]SQD79921.1 exported protein of unknown function, might be Phage integrase family protein [Moritella yayanosii]
MALKIILSVLLSYISSASNMIWLAGSDLQAATNQLPQFKQTFDILTIEIESLTELEVSDTEIIGLKCLSGKIGNKRFLLRYKFNGRKCSITMRCFQISTPTKLEKLHVSIKV